MINNLQISVKGGKLTGDVRSYVMRKIGGLDKFIPRRARESAFVEVKLTEKKVNNRKLHECEVIMKLPKNNITVHKNGLLPFAAIDEVEANLKNQLKKYKDLHVNRPRALRRESLKIRRALANDGLI